MAASSWTTTADSGVFRVEKDDRLWMRFPIAFDEDPVIAPLSDAAFRAFVEMNAYSRRNDLDGRIPLRYAVKRWGDEVLAELAAAREDSPFFVIDGDVCVLTKYDRHQDTTEARARRSETNRANGRLGGRKRVANRVASESLSETQATVKRRSSETQAESESETESETDSTTSNEVVPRARETLLPKDWAPTAEHFARARELGVDLVREVESFRLHAETHQRRAARWNAAFTSWLLKAKPTVPKPAVDWMNR
jgi:hypothetical protein